MGNFANTVLAAVASTNDDTKHKTFFLFFFLPPHIFKKLK